MSLTKTGDERMTAKPKKMTETVIVTYWQCMVHEHRHKREEVAVACIQKSIRAQLMRRQWNASLSLKPKRWDERQESLVIRQRESGMTFNQIGLSWQISAVRANQIYHMALYHRSQNDLKNTAWIKWLKSVQIEKLAECLTTI